MKNTILYSIAVFISLLSSFTCKKDDDQNFCTKNRIATDTFYNRTGTVYFIEPYGKWGIRIDSAIDSMGDSFIGFPCNLANNYRWKS